METKAITLTTIKDLDVVADKELAIAVFTQGGLTTLKDELQAQFDAFEPDTSTLAGREAIKAFSFKFAKDKSLVDDIGTELIEDEKNTVKAVQAACKDWRVFCDEKRKAAREPLTQYEAVAKAKKEAQALAKKQEDEAKEKQRLQALKSLKKTRSDLLISILGDDYDASDFDEWGLGEKTDDEFQVIVGEAKEQAAADLKAAQEEQAEEKRLADRKSLLDMRYLVMEQVGYTVEFVQPTPDEIAEMSDAGFNVFIATFREDRIRLEAEEKARNKAKADQAAAKRLADEQARDREAKWQGRISALNGIDGCLLEVEKESLISMGDEQWLKLYASETEKAGERARAKAVAAEKAKAESLRLEELFSARSKMLKDIKADQLNRGDLQVMSDEEWTRYYNSEVKRIEEAEELLKRKKEEAEAQEDAHQQQIEAEAFNSLRDALGWDDEYEGQIDEVFECIIKNKVKHVSIKY